MSAFNLLYTVQSACKLLFLGFSVLNLRYTLLLALAASLMGVLRNLKTPRFSKEYLEKFILNPHGQNIIYIGMGAMGYCHYLYYAPIALYFAFSLLEFVNLNFRTSSFMSSFMPLVNSIRNNKFYVREGRCRLQYFYFFFLVCTLPLDFIGRILKVLLAGQYLLLKYRVTQEARYAASLIGQSIDNATSSVSFINGIYKKLSNMLYGLANAQPSQ